MEKTRTVNISHHSDDPNVGLGSTEDLIQYKMFVGDTGLFVTHAYIGFLWLVTPSAKILLLGRNTHIVDLAFVKSSAYA